MNKTVCIAFEGIDGCGKTTQSELLLEYLQKLGKKCVLVQQGNKEQATGKLLKKYLKQKKLRTTPFITAPILVLDTAITRMKKLKGDEDYIISDRSGLSNIVYSITFTNDSRAVRGFVEKMWATVNAPDVILFLDIKPETAMERIRKGRVGGLQAHEELNRLKKVREMYLKIMKSRALKKFRNTKYVILEADDLNPLAVHKIILSELKKLQVI